jgi:hypothetical protein
MTIKVGSTEIPVPSFISSELAKKKNRKLFDSFLRNVLAAQGKRIRDTANEEITREKQSWEIFNRLFKG